MTDREFFIAQMVSNGEDPDSEECKAFLARQEDPAPYLRLVVGGNVNHYPKIQLPPVTGAKLAAHRAAHEIFGSSSSPAEDMEAGSRSSRPASTFIRALAFGIAAMTATACVVLGIEALAALDQQIAWGLV